MRSFYHDVARVLRKVDCGFHYGLSPSQNQHGISFSAHDAWGFVAMCIYGEGQIQHHLIHLSYRPCLRLDPDRLLLSIVVVPVKRHSSGPNQARVISEANGHQNDWSKSTIPKTIKAWSAFSGRLSLVSDMVKPNETGGL
jgi:hypothetical protein